MNYRANAVDAKKVARLARRAAARCRAEATAAGVVWWASAKPCMIRAGRAGREALRRAIVASPPLIERAREGARPGLMKTVALARAAGERARNAAPGALARCRDISGGLKARLLAGLRRTITAWPQAIAWSAAMIVIGVLWGMDGGQPEPSDVQSQTAEVAVEPASAEPARTEPTREELVAAAWKRAQPKLLAADDEAGAEVIRRMDQLGAFFEERKGGAKPFADDVISMEGQMQFVGGVGEQMLEHTIMGLDNASRYFFDTPLVAGDHRPPEDRFAAYVRDRFRSRVLSPAMVRAAMKSAVDGYATRLGEIEGALLVELMADIPDGGKVEGIAPGLIDLLPPDGIDGLVSETTATVGGDLIVSVIQDQVADQIGNLVAGMIRDLITGLGGDVGKVKGLDTALELGADVGVGQAIAEGLKSQGYDPAGQIAANVGKCLDGIKSSVIWGDLQLAENYNHLLFLSYWHPDHAARSACKAAVAAAERDSRLGLRLRLHGQDIHASVRRATAIMRAIAGGDAQLSFRTPDDDRAKLPAAEVIRFAQEFTTFYGAGK